MNCLPFIHSYQTVAHDSGCTTKDIGFGTIKHHFVNFMVCKRCGKRKFSVNNRPGDHKVIQKMKLYWLEYGIAMISSDEGSVYNDKDWKFVKRHGVKNSDAKVYYYEYSPHEGEVIPLEKVVDNT